MRLFNLLELTLSVAAAVGLLVVGCGDTGANSGGGSGSYESVSIGGKRWMKKNLDIAAGNSWCYENNADNCAEYGRLYDWNTAKTACPSGWRLPDTAEWNRLVEEAGGWETAGKKLKSSDGWHDYGNGTDDYGFAALPGGYRNTGGKFYKAGNNGVWWTATEHGNNNSYAYVQDIVYEFDDIREDTRITNYGFSVRCVRQ